MKTVISTIIIKLEGKEIELSPFEARQVFTELGELFKMAEKGVCHL